MGLMWVHIKHIHTTYVYNSKKRKRPFGSDSECIFCVKTPGLCFRLDAQTVQSPTFSCHYVIVFY